VNSGYKHDRLHLNSVLIFIFLISGNGWHHTASYEDVQQVLINLDLFFAPKTILTYVNLDCFMV
jgi:hypothetical protein